MSCFLNDRRPDPDVSSYLLSSYFMIIPDLFIPPSAKYEQFMISLLICV